MNPNPKTIDVVLYSDSEKQMDILSFQFDDESCKIDLNSEDSQPQLKMVFSKLITESLENDIVFNLVVGENYDRELYIDVCKEYIQDLQKELNNSKERIRKELAGKR